MYCKYTNINRFLTLILKLMKKVMHVHTIEQSFHGAKFNNT